MKIKPKDLTKLTDIVLLTCDQLETDDPGLIRWRHRHHTVVHAKDPVKFLMRDLLQYNGGIGFIRHVLYGYMDDDEVDTALRSIFRKEIKPRYLA